jgi:hypothetical protein
VDDHSKLTGFAERQVIPCWFCMLGVCRDIREFQSRHGDQVIATGQFVLIRSSSYQSIGGHGAVRSAATEDVALARLIDQAGWWTRGLGERWSIAAARMYTSWRTLGAGLVKNLVDIFGGPTSTIATALAAIVLAWSKCVIPLALQRSSTRNSGRNQT